VPGSFPRCRRSDDSEAPSRPARCASPAPPARHRPNRQAQPPTAPAPAADRLDE
jgi:hypothetical protein